MKTKQTLFISILLMLLFSQISIACGNSNVNGSSIDVLSGKSGDYYADVFNEHLSKGISTEIHTDAYIPLYVGTEAMVLRDSVTSKEYYMYSGYSVVDTLQIDSALAWLQKGIEECPQRLDLRFGLAATYRMLDDGNKVYAIMEQTVDWILANKKAELTWISDVAVDPQQQTVESALHDYFTNCYYSTSFRHLGIKFAELGIKYNPNHSIFYNDKAAMLLEDGDKAGALKLMKKALELSPDDELIRSNIKYLESEK